MRMLKKSTPTEPSTKKKINNTMFDLIDQCQYKTQNNQSQRWENSACL